MSSRRSEAVGRNSPLGENALHRPVALINKLLVSMLLKYKPVMN